MENEQEENLIEKKNSPRETDLDPSRETTTPTEAAVLDESGKTAEDGGAMNAYPPPHPVFRFAFVPPPAWKNIWLWLWCLGTAIFLFLLAFPSGFNAVEARIKEGISRFRHAAPEPSQDTPFPISQDHHIQDGPTTGTKSAPVPSATTGSATGTDALTTGSRIVAVPSASAIGLTSIPRSKTQPHFAVKTTRFADGAAASIRRAKTAAGKTRIAPIPSSRTLPSEESYKRAMRDYQAGRREEALAAMRDLIRLHPERGGLRYQAGWLLMEMKRRDDAIALWREGLVLEPDQPILKAAIAFVEQK